MLLIDQSLELHRAPFAAAIAAGDPGPLLARARDRVRRGAGALDLNAGVAGSADDLVAAAAAVRRGLRDVPLFLDAGSAAVLAETLDRCASGGIPGPLVANALSAGEVRHAAGASLLRTCARVGAGLVIAPLHHDANGVAAPDALAETAREAIAAARTAGVTGSRYVDCLAYPPALDPPRARRSLALLRLLRGGDRAVPLVAVGNVGHGAPAELRAALRLAYTAAAVGAGAGALILPVAEAPLAAAVVVARRARAPHDDVEAWVAAVAAASRDGERVPRAPATEPALATATRLLFG